MCISNISHSVRERNDLIIWGPMVRVANDELNSNWQQQQQQHHKPMALVKHEFVNSDEIEADKN